MITISNNSTLEQLRAVDGTPVVNAAIRGGGAHFGASNAQEFARWHVSKGSADADLNPDLEPLRERSRSLARDNGLSSGIFTTLKDNVVGVGPRLALMPDYRALGKDKAWAEDFSAAVESGFRSFSESREIDARGHVNLAIMCRQVLDARMMNGEAIVLPLWRPEPQRFRWASRLQLVESDRLSNPSDGQDQEYLRGGVEIDRFQRPVAYHLRTQHPGDEFLYSTRGIGTWERVPAETPWGRKRVLHIYEAERAAQTRGKPILSAVIGKFRMLDNYQRTEMQAAVINAVVAAFMETPLDSDSMREILGGGLVPENKEYSSYQELQRESMVPLTGAKIIGLPPGTTMKPWTPGRSMQQYDSFIQSVLRDICAAISMPYELVTKDWSKLNYSSARAALLEAWRMFATHRAWLKTFFLDEVLALWMEEAVFAGALPLTPEEYFANRGAYSRCRWIWPGRGWVDPVKEAQGAEIRMNIGTSTLEQECAEQGLDWVEVLEQRSVEQKMIEALGLRMGDGRNVQQEEQPQLPKIPASEKDAA